MGLERRRREKRDDRNQAGDVRDIVGSCRLKYSICIKYSQIQNSPFIYKIIANSNAIRFDSIRFDSIPKGAIPKKENDALRETSEGGVRAMYREKRPRQHRS